MMAERGIKIPFYDIIKMKNTLLKYANKKHLTLLKVVKQKNKPAIT